MSDTKLHIPADMNTNININKKISRNSMILFLLLQLVLTGCQNDKPGSGNKVFSIAEINEKALQDCLSTIKIKAKARRLNLDASISDKVAVDLNQLQSETNALVDAKVAYEAEMLADFNSAKSLSVESSSENFSYNVNINASENDSSDLLSYDIEVSRSSDSESFSVNQTFAVDSFCNARLKNTEIENSKFDGRKFTISTVELYPGNQAGSLQKSEVQIEIPTDAADPNLFNGTESYYELARIVSELKAQGKKIYIPLPDGGLAQLSIEPLQETIKHLDPFIGKVVEHKAVTIKVYLKNIEVVSMLLGESTASEFSFSQNDESETWTVDENYWSQLTLKGSPPKANKVEADSNLFYQPGASRVELMSNAKYNYSNLGAYWSTKSTLASTSEWNYGVRLLSSPQILPRASSQLVATEHRATAELQASKFVEVNAPEVQAFIEKLKSYKSENRVQMALRIAELVNEQITYDYDSVSNGEVYPLTTTDVLSRKKGVCQHFANLFAAIARGVGLPTRIIVGFLISSDSAGLHAWNEIEVSDGVWLPIEPQSKTLLIQSGRYLPSAVSSILETGAMSPEEISMMGLFKFHFKLLEKVSIH